MTVDVTIFNSPFGDIRVVMEDCSNPLFVAKDIASVLGYGDTINAIKQHCKGVVIYRSIKDSLNRKQSVRVINQIDFYRLVFNSELKSALKYQNLIFEKVLKNNCELIELIGYDTRKTQEKIKFTSNIKE